jgi:hypothetical protein
MSRLMRDLSPGTYVVNPDTSPSAFFYGFWLFAGALWQAGLANDGRACAARHRLKPQELGMAWRTDWRARMLARLEDVAAVILASARRMACTVKVTAQVSI